MMKKDNVKQWQELDLVNHPSSALPISFYEWLGGERKQSCLSTSNKLLLKKRKKEKRKEDTLLFSASSYRCIHQSILETIWFICCSIWFLNSRFWCTFSSSLILYHSLTWNHNLVSD
jgi:hypothetical protein